MMKKDNKSIVSKLNIYVTTVISVLWSPQRDILCENQIEDVKM